MLGFPFRDVSLATQALQIIWHRSRPQRGSLQVATYFLCRKKRWVAVERMTTPWLAYTSTGRALQVPFFSGSGQMQWHACREVETGMANSLFLHLRPGRALGLPFVLFFLPSSFIVGFSRWQSNNLVGGSLLPKLLSMTASSFSVLADLGWLGLIWRIRQPCEG